MTGHDLKFAPINKTAEKVIKYKIDRNEAYVIKHLIPKDDKALLASIA